MLNKLLLTLVAVLAINCSGAEWAFSDFKLRSALDLDEARFPAGSVVELKIDINRLNKALQIERLTPENFALAAECGKHSIPLKFFVARRSPGETFVYFRFKTPPKYDRIMLYFGGKKSIETIPESANLLNGALLAEKNNLWHKNAPEVNFKIHNGQGVFQVIGNNPTPKGTFLSIKQTFTLPQNLSPGMPIELAFDGYSESKAMWPLQLSIGQLDSNKKELPERAFDPRWLTVQTAPEQAIRFRQSGKLDPRAKYLTVSIGWINNREIKKYDVFGKKLPDLLATLPVLKINRLELRAAHQVTFPGSHPQLYVQGDRLGTWALNMQGRTAPLFNNFPASVWAGGKFPTIPDRYYWPSGDGTIEFRIKPQWTPRTVVLIDNGRYNNKSFLTISYSKANNHFLLKMSDYAKKNLSVTIPHEIKSGEWTHIAFTWSSTQGVALFVNGKRIYQNKNYCPIGAFPRNNSVKLAEYTSLGADCHRFTQTLNVAKYRPFFHGALDSVRFSDGVRYQNNFIPSKILPIDEFTTASFDYERNFDGQSNRAGKWISGSIFAADVPPFSDYFDVETRSGDKKRVQYVLQKIPADNMPQNILMQTFYKQLPTTDDFLLARKDVIFKHKFHSGEKKDIVIPSGAVMSYVEIACPENVVALKAPILLKQGDVDPRSFGDIASSLNFDNCKNDHEKVCKAFNFLISSSDYFTFQGAEFPKGMNKAVSAEHTSLLAINCYACFECGPLNTIAVGLFTNGLKLPAVLTYGNWHLFQQVMINDKLRVFDLSAQQFYPSRNMDDAASLDDIEKDIYLLARTKRPEDSAAHFFRLGRRGIHPGMSLPIERLSYTLYPGEKFCYYWSNNGESSDLNVPGWQGNAKYLCRATWTNVQKETGSDNEVGRVVQRPLPHTATGMFSYLGRVRTNHGAFLDVKHDSFVYRIDSPYTIMSGEYSSGDPHASFELSWNNGQSWRKIKSDAGKCRIELPLRCRHAALLRVTTSNREKFSAKTFVQLNPRRLTGQVKPGVNHYRFLADAGQGDVKIVYRVPDKKIEVVGGYYFGAIPGAERQLFFLSPGKTKLLPLKGASNALQIRSTGDVQVHLQNGKLSIAAPIHASRQIAQVELRDGNARKFFEVLICPDLVEINPQELSGVKKLKVNAKRIQLSFKGRTMITLPKVKKGKYLIFSLTRRNNRQNSFMQLYVYDSKGNEWVGARVRNPGVDYYKATYGSGKYSRYRWDFLTGKDTYPRRSNEPHLLDLGIKTPDKLRLYCPAGECAGMFIMPADDKNFMYQVIRNLTSINRANYIYDFATIE